MNKAFEEILSRLEDLKLPFPDKCYGGNTNDLIEETRKVVQKVAEEHNNGWIPCSEKLPDDFMSMEYLTTVKGHFYTEINYYCVANHKWFSSRKTTKEVDVIAWQPLPNTFKEREQNE